MTVLESYRYRDPIEVLEIDEKRDCKGCIHKFKWIALGVEMCALKNEPAKNGCKHYELPEEE